MALIADRVALAREGKNPWVITRLPSGWAVIGDVQFLPGYCLLLADQIVPSLNDLSIEARGQFLQDMARIGDAILQATGASRINYEILGNTEPELHAHIFPRYISEPDEKRRMPAWFYDWKNAIPYSEQAHGHIVQAIRQHLQSEA
ncbi:hypothetical protein LG201_08810 [Methylobacillus gramineus]|uniref:HIT family protein n=1 Tax=Methylobacillus gramineus TaxID=755169 RepID=UPI001CFFDF6D|nr:HIT domain-containing protein [Methylobacillus gramineus]MCB5185303.1 hypothetical protein [Methylobacillus gramineus]